MKENDSTYFEKQRDRHKNVVKLRNPIQILMVLAKGSYIMTMQQHRSHMVYQKHIAQIVATFRYRELKYW